MMLRVGLVARGYRSKQLTQIGAVDSMYSIKWRIDVDPDTNERNLSSQNQLAGTYKLVSPGMALKLAPPTSVELGQQAYDAEKQAMASRCGRVIPEIKDPNAAAQS